MAEPPSARRTSASGLRGGKRFGGASPGPSWKKRLRCAHRRSPAVRRARAGTGRRPAGLAAPMAADAATAPGGMSRAPGVAGVAPARTAPPATHPLQPRAVARRDARMGRQAELPEVRARSGLAFGLNSGRSNSEDFRTAAMAGACSAKSSVGVSSRASASCSSPRRFSSLCVRAAINWTMCGTSWGCTCASAWKIGASAPVFAPCVLGGLRAVDRPGDVPVQALASAGACSRPSVLPSLWPSTRRYCRGPPGSSTTRCS
jgi:hypothetical protein